MNALSPRRHALVMASALALAGAGGCSETPPATATSRLAVAVAPLRLPGITGACYHLEVFGTGLTGPLDATTRVWSADLCSGQYGTPDGALSYVGTCDADGGPRDNTVTLALTSLDGEDGPLEEGVDFQNPCPADAPCRQVATCRESADARVDFDLTVLRSAEQGFFDVAVSFEDIFCSAKVDCAHDLLFDADGVRADTVVLAFACSAGPGRDTHLYLSDVYLVCGAGADARAALTLDPTGGVGNRPLPAGAPAGVFGWAVYRDVEDLPGLRKAFWNTAVGVSPSFFAGHAGCSLEAWGTAHDGALAAPFVLTSGGPDGVYPYVRFDVPLDPAGAGALSCGQRPLDGAPAGGVTTAYAGRPGADPVCFQGELSADWTAGTTAARRVASTCPMVPASDACGRTAPEPTFAPVASHLVGAPAVSGASTAHAALADGGDCALGLATASVPGSGSVDVDTLAGGAAIEAPTTGTLALSDAITVETWLKIEEVRGYPYAADHHYAVQGIAHSGDSLSDCGFTFIGYQNDPGRDRMFLSFTVQQDGTGQTNARFDGTTDLHRFAGRWVHVAGVWQSGWQYPKLYIDGTEETGFTYRNSGATSLRVPGDATRVGAMKYNGSLSGDGSPNTRARFDETRIWSVARTAAELRGAMGVALTGAEPGLAAYWRWEGDLADASPGDHDAAAVTHPPGQVALASEPASRRVVSQRAADDGDASVVALGNDTTDAVILDFDLTAGPAGAPARVAGGVRMRWSGAPGEAAEVETGLFVGDAASGSGSYYPWTTYALTAEANAEYRTFVAADWRRNPESGAAWQTGDLGRVHLYVRSRGGGSGGRYARVTQAGLVLAEPAP